MAAALWEWDSFSWRVSQKRIFVYCPIGRPREVVSMWPLRAEGGRWSGEVVLTRSVCGFLASAWWGPLIKPAVVSLVQEINPRRILIAAGRGYCRSWGSLGYFTEVRILSLGRGSVPGAFPDWWCLSFLLRGLIFRGSLGGWDGGGWFSLPWSLGGEGVGSGIQLRRRSKGCPVTYIYTHPYK